jgi:dynein heavy chain
VQLKPEILSGMELGPGFPVPDCSTLDYAGIADYFLTSLPKESPPMFGLHPNAEIGYLTAFADDLFGTILSLGGGGGGGAGGGGGSAVRNTMNDLLERLPENFSEIDIEIRAQPLLMGPSGPYVIVAMQECARMNELLNEIRRSLLELRKGLDGSLNMSESMEDLAASLGINLVPGRNPYHKCSWEKWAWPSRRPLYSWFLDMLRRVEQLRSWSSNLVTPMSFWLPGIFNPMAVLTAVMQVTARSTGLPLDKMAIDTHVSAYANPEAVTAYAEHGLYAHGMFMEGSRWATGDEAGEVTTVGHTPVSGFITESRLKQLLPAMPLLYLRAVPVGAKWIPSGVGYLRQDPAVYECPVYFTTFRGPTYVFLATLRSIVDTSKWVLAGTALVMQEDT